MAAILSNVFWSTCADAANFLTLSTSFNCSNIPGPAENMEVSKFTVDIEHTVDSDKYIIRYRQQTIHNFMDTL